MMWTFALVAVICSSAMLYAFAAQMFASRAFGVLTAGLFVSTPLVWTQLRDSPVSLFPLPFVASWLLAVVCISGPRASLWCAVAGVALGAGVYTTLAAAVMMPLYLLLTVIVFAHARTIPLRQLGVIVAAFAVSAAPYALNVLWHPDDFRTTVNTLRLYDANRFNVLQGMREMVSWVGLTARSEVYYNYFNPAFLFLIGGVLLLPLIGLVPIGLYRLLDEHTPIARLTLLGLLAAPAAAALTAEAPIPRRILYITPFAAIVSAYGVQLLVSWLRRLPDSLSVLRPSVRRSRP